MVLLPKIQESAIVDNLKKRLLEDVIYVSYWMREGRVGRVGRVGVTEGRGGRGSDRREERGDRREGEDGNDREGGVEG